MNPDSQTIYDNTTMLERVLLSAVAALFVAFGLVMLLRQLDTSLLGLHYSLFFIHLLSSLEARC
jgi:hypothetical protein